MINTVIFDLNKVLVSYDKSDESNRKYLDNFGIDRETFWKNRIKDLEKYELDEISLSQLLSNQLEKNGISLDKIELALKCYKEGLRVVEGIPELLKKLSKNYNLILLAGDGSEALSLKLDRFNLRNHFTKVYSTGLSKMTKTDSQLYKLILDENKLLPDEVLFIDDQQRYLETARSIGIKSIKFENCIKLIEDLAIIEIR